MLFELIKVDIISESKLLDNSWLMFVQKKQNIILVMKQNFHHFLSLFCWNNLSVLFQSRLRIIFTTELSEFTKKEIMLKTIYCVKWILFSLLSYGYHFFKLFLTLKCYKSYSQIYKKYLYFCVEGGENHLPQRRVVHDLQNEKNES